MASACVYMWEGEVKIEAQFGVKPVSEVPSTSPANDKKVGCRHTRDLGKSIFQDGSKYYRTKVFLGSFSHLSCSVPTQTEYIGWFQQAKLRMCS
jgi:hypothetical protein